MRLDKPRLEPLGKADWSEEVRQTFDKNGDRDENDVFNIFKTLAHHPKLMKRWMPFANHILFKSTLSPRDREILILRIGCRRPRIAPLGRQGPPAAAGHRRTARRRFRLRPHMERAGRTLLDPAAHGPRLHRGQLQPGLHGPEQPRRPARRRPGRLRGDGRQGLETAQKRAPP